MRLSTAVVLKSEGKNLMVEMQIEIPILHQSVFCAHPLWTYSCCEDVVGILFYTNPSSAVTRDECVTHHNTPSHPILYFWPHNSVAEASRIAFVSVGHLFVLWRSLCHSSIGIKCCGYCEAAPFIPPVNSITQRLHVGSFMSSALYFDL